MNTTTVLIVIALAFAYLYGLALANEVAHRNALITLSSRWKLVYRSNFLTAIICLAWPLTMPVQTVRMLQG